MDSTKIARRGKEKEILPRDSPRPTDIDERLLSARRRAARESKPRERPERDLERRQPPPPSHPPSHPPSRSSKQSFPSGLTKPTPVSPRRNQNPAASSVLETESEEFNRRLTISSPAPRAGPPITSKPTQTKLYNPDTDPIPMRRQAELEPSPEATHSSYLHPTRPQPQPGSISPAPAHAMSYHRGENSSHPSQQRLFDHRKDDPVRFAAPGRTHGSSSRSLAKPPADCISVSSGSSFSTFTLSATTTDGSESALFDQNGMRPSSDLSDNAFADKLKKLYRSITHWETKIKQEDIGGLEENEEAGRTVRLKGKQQTDGPDEKEKEKWDKRLDDHKRLADLMQHLLEISLSPSVPASLRNIPTKYNVIVRLWTYGFHKLLEALRRASFTSALAFEYLQEFIYYAYIFYTGLLEEPSLSTFKGGWLEALGDLARYRMAVAAMIGNSQLGGDKLTAASLSEVPTTNGKRVHRGPRSLSDAPAARIDDSPSPSVGLAAARALEVEPEKERWRNVAKEWYATGLAEQPGTGKLHHHLGLLCREVEADELRGVYHFAKSLTTLHPFLTSRESVLPIWSVAAQTRRALPDAHVTELFVLIHGMLFTNIQLDDFQPTLARLLERLDIDITEEREWIMMAIINVASIYEYGKPSGIIKRVAPLSVSGPAVGGVRVVVKRPADDRMEVDDISTPTAEAGPVQLSPAPSDGEVEAELPQAFKNGLQITFAMLSHVLRTPYRRSSQYAQVKVNPYLTVILTFLATVTKNRQILSVMERVIPWGELATFFASSIPEKVMKSECLLTVAEDKERWQVLSSNTAPPLPEDWCIRGMEWVGRKVYERGFWKAGDERRMELEALDDIEIVNLTDGMIDQEEAANSPAREKRWVRIIRCGVTIASIVEGFTWVQGTKQWQVEGSLAGKVERWRKQDSLEKEAEEKRRMGKRWVDLMDVDEGELFGDGFGSSEGEEDENDSEEVKALKARRQYLRSLLQNQQHRPPRQNHSRARQPLRPETIAKQLTLVPGHTVLVMDTNLLLSSLTLFSSLVESFLWTVIVPLPVIMELDGLANNTSSPQLALGAKEAAAYINAHIRSHSASMKVQTSRGNFLPNLTIRTEQVDFNRGRGGTNEQNMDDLILRAAIWQEEHWVDRSKLLSSARQGAGLPVQPAPSPDNLKTADKVVLLSLDRNLRLKARARQLAAASEKDLAGILMVGT